MKATNPYNYNLPVGPEMFFGRQGDVERLARHLMAAPGDSFALIAGRRMGKTSLLEAILRSLELCTARPEQGQREPVKGAESGGDVLPLPVFLDFSGAGVDSTPAFFQAVAAEAQALLVDRLGLSPDDVPALDETGPPASAFRRALEAWGRVVMAQRGRRPRLILLLDECEQIVERPWSADLYGALRSLLVGRATRSSLKVVMTGSHRFLTQVRQRGSPLRNVLAYHMLYALKEEATLALITRPSGDTLPTEIVQAIAAQSGGHPFLTQYLMRHLWERGLDGVTLDVVRQVAADFFHERNDFADWATGLGEAGLKVYRALVQAGEALAEEQVRATLRPVLPNLPQALEGLCYHGLIVRDAEGGYGVAGDMFREWFAANAAGQSEGGVPLDLAPDAVGQPQGGVPPAAGERPQEPIMPEPTDSSPRQPQETQPLHVTWLHISDLHFRASQTYDASVVLDALLRDVAERVQQDGLHPDFIAVTGDVAFAGQAAEYALARRFFDDLLKATGLPGKRLFVVPGNHDVNRKLISAGAKAIGDALTDRDKANELLSTPGDRRLLFAHFQGYAEFVNDYLDHLAFDDEHYFYVHTLDLAGQQVALLGLNSAWLCAGDEDKAKGLVLGERQVRTALKQAQGASLKIALLHHPFDWLREFDQGDSAAMLLDGCDFVLHGHLHQTAATQLISPDGAATVLACGACYETRQFPNMVNWVRLDLAAGDGAVHLRRYSDERGGFWAKDTLSYRNAPDGVYSFLRVPARAPQGPPVGGEPGQPPETGAAPLAAERDACVDVQALHPPRQTPPDGSPITERDDDATPSGDSSRARLEQRRREHQTRWDDLSGRIQALQKDLGQEMDGERRQTLESRLAERRTERDQVEAALHKIERRLE